MSARKKVNQSRPRALACGVALAVAGAVCFNVASDGRPASARRSSRPPSNSSASVDSPLSPAPRGNYGVGVWPNAPRTRPPLSARIPPPSTRRKEYRSVLAGTQICERGYFEKHCEFRKQRAPWNKVPKFRNPCARRNAPMAKLRQRLFCAVSCQPAMGTKRNDCASKRRPLGRAFEASLADAQLEPAESVVMRAVHFRSRIPAMALT
jgi:hypothetical protein